MSAAIASGITSKGSRDWTDEVEDDEEDVPIQSNENKSTSHQGDSNQREQHNQQYSRNQRDRGQRNQQSGYQRRNDGGGRGRGGGAAAARKRPPFVAFVSNLNYIVTEDDIGKFFVGGGCKVKDVTLNKENGKSRGSALVEFHDEDSLTESLTANNFVFKDRPIKVEIDGSQSRNRDDGQRNDGQRSNYQSRQSSDTRYSNKQNYNNNHHPNEKPRDRGAPSGENTVDINTESTSSANRPKLELKPRTLPVEKIGEPVANSDIFGGAKPNDLLAYEAEKKKKEAEEEAQKPKEEKKIDDLVEDLSLKEKQASDTPSSPVEKDGKQKVNKVSSSSNSNSHAGQQEGKGRNRSNSRGGEKPRKPRALTGDVGGGDKPKPKKIEDGPPKREGRERAPEAGIRNDKGRQNDNRKKNIDNPKSAIKSADNKISDNKQKKVIIIVIIIIIIFY